MPVTTTSAAVHIAPVVVKTFFNHGKRKAREIKQGREEEDAKDDIFYDEAFHIVKAFIELGTKNTVESLQAFTNTHVPSPPWAAVSPVVITLSSCNRAADILIDWFGPYELKYTVGGERWWQVRGLDGVDGEWISGKDYLDSSAQHNDHGKKLSNNDRNILRMNHLETVMLYVHGGGYFWGSINTHRYQIIRYARKFRGRAFAVNYRKAPQYPWPCAIQDVLAAYLYLIEPPHGALHKAVPPSKIVMAGDSAGGGLCVAALTILRDLGLPMPAGAVLISPWVDLTHSFPSIMDNRNTDIIPQHGFLAKPSTLWPLDPLPKGDSRVISSQPYCSQTRGNTDNPRLAGNENDIGSRVQNSFRDASLAGGSSSGSQCFKDTEAKECTLDSDKSEPKPSKVLMENDVAVPLELNAQIQLYATNEQLCHALVSPILQGSLGNLPPLYVLAGDDEVLRDEIIYLAHRAAHPSEYPAKQEVLRYGHRQKENAERFTVPTKVHLQVYDGMCHVLTVFTFTESAKCAYRSIAEFVRHVAFYDAEQLAHNPFPETHRLPAVPHATKTGYQHRPFNETRNQVLQLRNGEKKHSQVEKPNDASRNLTNNSSNVLMIRERVNIRGIRRNMEPPHEMKALQLLPVQVGIIKEGPTRRWLEGQRKWDIRFEYAAKKVIKHRAKIESLSNRLLENARVHGLLVGEPHCLQQLSTSESKTDVIQDDRRWGPLDLADERPPPSAIARRRDTHEALALLKKTIYHTAPVTHQTVPELRVTEAIRAALNPRDDLNRPPQQSVSEQQVQARLVPVHGLRLWDSIIRFFSKKTLKRQKPKKGIREVRELSGY